MLEAERLAAGNDWRGGVNRFRALLDQWKALPRLDRATDDELWHRFSTARTAYTRRRKAQFARENEAREAARIIKEQLVDRGRGAVRLDRLGPDHRRLPGHDGAVEGRRPGAAGSGRDAVEAVPRRPGHLLRRQAGDPEPAGHRVPGQRRGQGGAAGRGGGPAAGARPGRGQGGVPRHPAPLVGHREGAAGLDPAARRPAARRGDRHRRRGERPLAADQPGDPGPGRGHRRQAGGADRRPRAAGGQG